MEVGEIGILNIGAGHNKIQFDPNDPEGMKNAASILKDMMKAGYIILVEVDDGQGGKTHQRVKRFQEDTLEYIISPPKETKVGKGKGRAGTSRIRATKARGVAVARTSGG